MGSSMTIEKPFSKTATRTTAMNEERKLYKNASDKNCLINCALDDPVTLRIPTSLALLEALAVERFIKFTQASSTINTATLPKIYMYLMLLMWLSQGMPIDAALRWTSVRGIR